MRYSMAGNPDDGEPFQKFEPNWKACKSCTYRDGEIKNRPGLPPFLILPPYLEKALSCTDVITDAKRPDFQAPRVHFQNESFGVPSDTFRTFRTFRVAFFFFQPIEMPYAANRTVRKVLGALFCSFLIFFCFIFFVLCPSLALDAPVGCMYVVLYVYIMYAQGTLDRRSPVANRGLRRGVETAVDDTTDCASIPRSRRTFVFWIEQHMSTAVQRA